MDSTVRINIAVINIHIAVFFRVDNILKYNLDMGH